MKNRLLFLLRCYATTVLVFIVAKVVFNKDSHHIGETVRVRIVGSTSATLLGESV